MSHTPPPSSALVSTLRTLQHSSVRTARLRHSDPAVWKRSFCKVVAAGDLPPPPGPRRRLRASGPTEHSRPSVTHYSRRMRRRTGLVTAGAAALLWGEWLNRRWSRTLVGSAKGGTDPKPWSCWASATRSRRRTSSTAGGYAAGLRSVSADNARDTSVIFSGGAATGSPVTEARLMADYAKSVLAFDGTVLLEDRSTTTWENITNVIPMLEDADRIKIASQPAARTEGPRLPAPTTPRPRRKAGAGGRLPTGRVAGRQAAAGAVRALDTPRPQGRRTEDLPVDDRCAALTLRSPPWRASPRCGCGS